MISLNNDFDNEEIINLPPTESQSPPESSAATPSTLEVTTDIDNNPDQPAALITPDSQQLQQQRPSRKRGGRPSGSTKKAKKKKSDKEKEATHNIICRYMWNVEHADLNNTFKKDIFRDVMERARVQYKLAESFHLPYETVLSRIRRNNLSGDGHYTPLLPVENKIVELIVCMSKLKRSLKASEGLRLVNELIDGTLIQQRLIDWKDKMNIYSNSLEDRGKVGMSYWRSFMHRNSHIIRSKPGCQFSVDRSNWSNYLNFRDMYLHIMEVLTNESKIATRLDDAV